MVSRILLCGRRISLEQPAAGAKKGQSTHLDSQCHLMSSQRRGDPASLQHVRHLLCASFERRLTWIRDCFAHVAAALLLAWALE